jgi:hypothetical protein
MLAQNNNSIKTLIMKWQCEWCKSFTEKERARKKSCQVIGAQFREIYKEKCNFIAFTFGFWLLLTFQLIAQIRRRRMLCLWDIKLLLNERQFTRRNENNFPIHSSAIPSRLIDL